MDITTKTPWVGAETLSWFYRWCRDHGISGDNHKLKAGIVAGVFGSAAVAVRDADTAEGYSYFIFPARLERWAEENAVDYI